MVQNDENNTVSISNNKSSPSSSIRMSITSRNNDSVIASTCSNKNTIEFGKMSLKRKNIDKDDEVIEAKTKSFNQSGNIHKIKTRSQTAKALCSKKNSDVSILSNSANTLVTNKIVLSTDELSTEYQESLKPASNLMMKKSELLTQIDSNISSKIKDEENNIKSYNKNNINILNISNDHTTEAWLNTFKEWNNKNKLNALEQILEICEHSHIKHVHNFIEPKLQRDYISELPRELVLLLLTYVRPRDLYKLAQVSHYWHQIANDTILWKNICKRHRIDLDNLNNNTSMILNEFKDNNFGKDNKRKIGNEINIKEKDTNDSVEDAEANLNESDSDNIADSEAASTETKTSAAGCCSPTSPSSSISFEPTTSKQACNENTLSDILPTTSSKSLSSSKFHKCSKGLSSKKRNKSQKSLNHKVSQSITKPIILTSLPYFNNTISKKTLLSCQAVLKLVKTPLNEFLESFNQYKRAYLIDYNVAKNWCQRALPKPFVLRSHDDHVITCLKFDGFRVVSGSDDCTLKVWCALTGKLLHTLVGHTGGVWASQLKDNIVISGSTDRSVRVWNIDTGECIHILTGHTSTVRCLALHSNIVISGSRDSLLRVWNIESGQCMQILRGHVAAVRCVCFDGNYVVSGSYDFTIRVWNPFKNECLHVLEGHSNRVYSLLFEGNRIVSGSLDTTIIVWNVHTGTIIHKLIGHHSLTSGMQIKNDILVSGNADSTVKIWSLKTGECIHTLAGTNKHMSAVTCLSFNEKFVVSSSDDGTVKLWNVETGEFIRNLLGLDSGGRGGVVWRISMHKNKLVCAVGSRIGVEETKLILLDFDWPPLNLTEKVEETQVIKTEENLQLSNIFNEPIENVQV